MLGDIIFVNSLDSICPNHGGTIELAPGLGFHTNQDIYFKAKWNEVYERYETARMFVTKAKEDRGWDYWFAPFDDAEKQKAFENMIKARLYEAALINYNILVDLTWAWTYASAGYLIYSKNNGKNEAAENVIGLCPIEDADDCLRKIECGTKKPSLDKGTFASLKEAAPNFETAINIVADFWDAFKNTNVRNLYNFIKHRGELAYIEIDNLRGGDTRLYICGQNFPSNISDVQKKASIEQGLEELINLDNESLLPYIEKLCNELKSAVNVSPVGSLL